MMFHFFFLCKSHWKYHNITFMFILYDLVPSSKKHFLSMKCLLITLWAITELHLSKIHLMKGAIHRNKSRFFFSYPLSYVAKYLVQCWNNIIFKISWNKLKTNSKEVRHKLALLLPTLFSKLYTTYLISNKNRKHI